MKRSSLHPRGCISGGIEISLMTRLKGTVANCMGHKVGVLSYDDARFTHHYVFKFTAHCRGPTYDKPFNRNQSYVANLRVALTMISYIITSTIFLLMF